MEQVISALAQAYRILNNECMGSIAIFVLPTGAVHSLLFAIHIHTAYWSQNISSRLSTETVRIRLWKAHGFFYC